jgi:hypothetical protein
MVQPELADYDPDNRNIQQNDGILDFPSAIAANAKNTVSLNIQSEKSDLIQKPVSGSSTLKSKIQQNDGLEDDDEEEDQEDENLGSDLDESESDNEEVETANLILCQYEKVSRVKNKWKCVFKDGVVHVNGKDYLFNRANGEFEW